MRLLIEVEEYVSPAVRIDDTYVLNERVASYADFRRKEREALQVTPEEFLDFTRKTLKVFAQFRKGLIGPGDEVAIDGPDSIRYHFSTLEDAGKRTGMPWKNSYAFGPLTKRDANDPRYNGEQGWPNHVKEAPKGPRPRMIPVGVGHDPSGNQY